MALNKDGSFGADPALRSILSSARVSEIVPVATDLATARVLLERRPAQVLRHRDLPMHEAAAAAARVFVRETCAVWSVPDVVEDRAELVCSELVTNAVLHAPQLDSGEADWLCIQAAGFGPGLLPRPRPVDIDAPCGRGLHLVALFADNWGAHQRLDGKTIWANLAYPHDRQSRPGDQQNSRIPQG